MRRDPTIHALARRLRLLLPLVLGIASAGLAQAARQGPSALPFPAQSLSVDTSVTHVEVADLDRDGDDDLVVCTRWTTKLYVAMGVGDGSFEPPVEYGVAFDPRDAVAADFDGDGDLDLAVACYGEYGPGKVCLLWNVAGGHFGAPTNLPLSPHPIALAAGDVDMDGDVDLAVVFDSGTTATLLDNSGTGVFTVSASLSHGARLLDVDLLDLDYDGDPELVLESEVFGVWTHENLGPAGFAAGVHYQPGNGMRDFLLHDVNQDGGPDAIALLTGIDVAVGLNDGFGHFGAPLFLQLSGPPGQIGVGDVDSDSIPDLVYTLPGTKEIAWSRGAGDGSFSGATTAYAGRLVETLTVHDVDANGAADVLLGDIWAHVTIHLGDGARLGSLERAPHGTFSSSGVAAGDLDGDGDQDLVLVGTLGDYASVLSDGNGGWGAPLQSSTTASLGHVVLADLDLDGDDDVVSVGFVSTLPVTLLHSIGGGMLQEVGHSPHVGYVRGLAVGDVDDDGLPDLVLSTGTPYGISVLLNQGNGLFGAEHVQPLSWRAKRIELADMDGDGLLDLVAHEDYPADRTVVLRNLGAGDFSPPLSEVPVIAPRDFRVVDLDGDGGPDVVYSRNAATGGLYALWNDGAGHLSGSELLAECPAGWVECADFDADGDVDLAAAPSDGTVRVFRNAGDGRLEAEHRFLAPRDPVQILAGAFGAGLARDVLLVEPYGGGLDLLRARLAPPGGNPFCSGDGNAAPCPCGNADVAGAGCRNSTGFGAVLRVQGALSLAAGELVLRVHDLPGDQACLFFQGDTSVNGGAGASFCDGLRCVGGNVMRLEVRVASGTGEAFTTADLGLVGAVAAGSTKAYQAWYRDPHGSPCGHGLNLSNGVRITWQP
ncbi:MAG: VCBS repeat-containing protein [Planctomycetes bacterium]|nr:VCBS repeat-containing protein [Planctomycetota bacterium]